MAPSVSEPRAAEAVTPTREPAQGAYHFGTNNELYLEHSVVTSVRRRSELDACRVTTRAEKL